MAKKTRRVLIQLECPKCHQRNYTTSKNRDSQKGKVKLKKYCSKCQKHIEHKEQRISSAKK